ncbi:aspartate aminotransferase family protein [Chitinasiproducens palmae]|uniref:Glutamate-1-semialdehyde 2,1-aminomutase n=1 Tax=Chitinasiproducens palmae TaxID=1770053 RepID=A0A1H2PTC7_9BURK|nr:aspartate aminotransferase family protein [Chitinasiproducens palmae]SDV49489.1 glutamate-1-semialdehyde 2,1-aminomutase [Chitinasiproducens palmae]
MYPDSQSRSSQLYARAKHSLPGGNTRTTVFMKPYPIYAASGAGCRVVDVDGVSRIDCINNFTALIHGHGQPEVVAAACAQIARGTSFGMPTEAEIELAELLCARVASIEAVRFTNSGTEAVMMAIKAARAFTGKRKIAKVEGAYHGSYDYAETSLDATPANWGEGSPLSVPYAQGTPQGVLDDVVVLPFNDIEATEALLRTHAASLAGVLVDPVPNRVGLIPASEAYLAALRRLTTELGMLLIIDEVITLRLASGGAQSRYGVVPDLTTVGKIMGGGFPVGAVGGRAEVMAVFDPSTGRPAVPHGGTFSANPVTMAAGLTAMRLLDEAAHARLNAQGDRLRDMIRAAFANAGLPGQATGVGSLIKVHFHARPIRDYRSAFPTAEEQGLLSRLVLELLNRGVITASYGLIALSSAMDDADIATIGAAFDDALRAIAASAS